jgi:hypothetical protein
MILKSTSRAIPSRTVDESPGGIEAVVGLYAQNRTAARRALEKVPTRGHVRWNIEEDLTDRAVVDHDRRIVAAWYHFLQGQALSSLPRDIPSSKQLSAQRNRAHKSVLVSECGL